MSDDGMGGAATIALVAIIPLVVLMLTSFVKISVVLSLLRNAIGSPDAPSGLVVMGLSLILTFFVMAPVAIEMIQQAGSTDSIPVPTKPPNRPTPAGPAGPTATPTPPTTNTPSPPQTTPQPTPAPPTALPTTPPTTTGSVTDPGIDTAALKPLELDRALHALVPAQHHDKLDKGARAIVPLRAFLTRHAGAKDRDTFVGLAQRMGNVANGDELWVLAPAFLTTELREAFAIAVLIFIPFLVIDLIVGLALAALGLQSTSPQNVALPLKLLLFVAVDGWRLLIEGLLRGYV